MQLWKTVKLNQEPAIVWKEIFQFCGNAITYADNFGDPFEYLTWVNRLCFLLAHMTQT